MGMDGLIPGFMDSITRLSIQMVLRAITGRYTLNQITRFDLAHASGLPDTLLTRPLTRTHPPPFHHSY